MIFAGALEDAIDERKIILALRGLDPVPADANEDGVEIGLGELGPDLIHVFEAGGGGIVGFAGEDEEGFAIDDQLGGGAALFQAGEMRVGSGGGDWNEGGRQGQQADEGQTNIGLEVHEVPECVVRFTG